MLQVCDTIRKKTLETEAQKSQQRSVFRYSLWTSEANDSGMLDSKGFWVPTLRATPLVILETSTTAQRHTFPKYRSHGSRHRQSRSKRIPSEIRDSQDSGYMGQRRRNSLNVISQLKNLPPPAQGRRTLRRWIRSSGPTMNCRICHTTTQVVCDSTSSFI